MKGHPINLVGQRFGQLTVIELVEGSASGRIWLVRCDCGAERHLRTNKLRSGDYTSCGCRRRERMQEYWESRRRAPVDGVLQCHDCKERLPVENFSPCKRTSSGRSSRCKRCHNIRSVRKRTGVSLPEAREWFKRRTEGCCEVCKSTADLNIDHNHSTGRVRGILCGDCNRALGLLKEDIGRIFSLRNYLIMKGSGL